MRSIAPFLIALATFAAAVPSQRAGVPDLPDGLFSGVNNADGTTTLTFEDGQSFNFVRTEPQDTPLQKRTRSDCWRFQGELNHDGVDQGCYLLRQATDHGFVLGRDGNPKYLRYNSNAVYVYFCQNNNGQTGRLNSNIFDNFNYSLDQICGAYQAGHYMSDTNLLLGKALSGTSVCKGKHNSG